MPPPARTLLLLALTAACAKTLTAHGDDASSPSDVPVAADTTAAEDAATLEGTPSPDAAPVDATAPDAASPDVTADAPPPEDAAPKDAEDTDVPASCVPSACAWRRCTSRGCDDPVEVAVGGTHTCALRAAGTVVCWGRNGFGQLGNGRTRPDNTAVEVLPPEDA